MSDLIKRGVRFAVCAMSALSGDPVSATVVGEFTPRGGIETKITATFVGKT